VSRLPSLQKPRDFISVFDAAIAKPADDATDEERAAFHDRIRIARETGDYSDVLVPGARPVKFVLAPLRESQFLDLVDANLGDMTLHATAFRLACVSVVGFELEPGKPYQLPKRIEDDRFGAILPRSVIDDLGAGLRLHIRDAATDVVNRAAAMPPKP
jgi:hypothetical protein